MSLTDKELREERKRPVFKGDRTVYVAAPNVRAIEFSGIALHEWSEAIEYLGIEEATALRDGLTVVIDQYHDFIARRDAKTNQEIIDEMEPGTVFEYMFRGVVREYVKLRDERIWGRGSSLNYTSSEFRSGAITVVNQ